ncbi:MAG: indole-3-glycerol phosphate synthase TrpC [Candidatus Omnitrophica bacterium]|nr:indole-3-glycerol phosphate synthase TrpC [Candidatus Omnitrophota bacterium]
MILNDILIQKKKDLEELKRRFPLHRLREACSHHPLSGLRSFQKAISGTRKLNLICEIKKASPSEGILREDFQPLRLAGILEYGGAAALSVLTEPHFFKGRPSYLKTIRQVTTIPILRKDFILETYQLYESALLEADAYLLIASILTESELQELLRLGRELHMDALVEVHAEEDLKKAIGVGATLIGINNRDLRNLSVDPHRAKRLIPYVPKGVTIVVESGLGRREDLMEYKSMGVSAFLIGTSLMKAPEPLEKLAELFGEDRKWKKAGASYDQG